jgi:hypothetical protein
MARDMLWRGSAAVWGLAFIAVLAAACGSSPAGSPGSWGRAVEVPGLAALHMRLAEVTSVSCGSAGDCAAGGTGFVAVERDGRWGRAVEVPGLGAAEVDSVSCALEGSCAAGGSYTDRRGFPQGFVTVGRDGRWGQAVTVPGPVSSVSCPSAGNCAAVGVYSARRGHSPVFVVSLRDGRWGAAVEVPGLGALDKGAAGAEVTSVSCGSAGNCAAGGDYTDRRGIGQGFVAVERNGRWGPAVEVPGLGALNKGGNAQNQMGAQVTSVSCGSAGDCAAGGGYWDSRGHSQGFVVSLQDGRWGTAVELPGLADAWVYSVSCGRAGTCAAGGAGFVAIERHGAWGRAVQLPRLAALGAVGQGVVLSVSCGPAGTCAAGGYYTDRRHHEQGFVAVERHGAWGPAVEVPGLAALNAGGNAGVSSVSCAPAGTCAAGGSYTDRRHHEQGFVVSQTR